MVKKGKKENLFDLKAKLWILQEEIRKDVSLPVVASFGFIIALVWRDAIKGLIDEFLSKKLPQETYYYDLVSAVIVTIVVMALMIMVTMFSRAKKEARIEKNIKKIKQIEKKKN